ncbi:hypothetical protein FF041_14200 [Streptomyces jumonjinensis]|uniref:Uncharacterized protein n=1 Tax=Streptomyces jumonjinensis TaxID=1945 RepID=A0A646KGB6_STRJU|nr:hypothetical protein [Streptomyces jumonjinensis]
MPKVPEGYHVVRSHVRRNPGRGGGAKRMSGWTIAGLAAGLLLWGQLSGSGESGSGQPGPRPGASASAPASAER